MKSLLFLMLPLLLVPGLWSVVAEEEAAQAADALWREVTSTMDAFQAVEEQAATREESIERFRGKLKAFDRATDAFIKAAPGDKRQWQAKLFGARLANARQLVGEESAVPIMEVLNEILAHEDAPRLVKSEASAAALIESANAAKNTEESREAWKAKLAAHLETYPDEPMNPNLEATAELMKPLELTFNDSEARGFDLEDYRGKVVLLDFWATWSEASVEQLPELIEIYNELHPKGFEIVGISLDTDREALDRLIKERGIPWRQQFEGKSKGHTLAERFAIDSIPSAWLINKQGMVVDHHARTALKIKVEELLEED